jgi:hypothetical protein
MDMRKHMTGKQKVFAVAFVDLSGAYDSIDRKLLFWKLEHQLGIADHTLDILRNLYRLRDRLRCQGGGVLQPAFRGRLWPAALLPPEHHAVQPVHLGPTPAPPGGVPWCGGAHWPQAPRPRRASPAACDGPGVCRRRLVVQLHPRGAAVPH